MAHWYLTGNLLAMDSCPDWWLIEILWVEAHQTGTFSKIQHAVSAIQDYAHPTNCRLILRPLQNLVFANLRIQQLQSLGRFVLKQITTSI